MSATDGLWHTLNFVLPVLGCSGFTALLAKLAWRSALRSTTWLRIWLASATAGGLGFLVMAASLGQDGKTVSYAILALGSALGAWWVLLTAR